MPTGRLSARLRLNRAARRLGVAVHDLPADIRFAEPDPTRWGLVPAGEVSAETRHDDARLGTAVAVARQGDWGQAAALVADTWVDWDRRARVVRALADVAAHDDTWLKAWRAAAPEDPHALVVHADALVRLAWQIRGSGWRHETTQRQIAGFRRVLHEAESAAYAAAMAVPEDPTPWLALVTAARGLGYDHDEFAEVWRGLTDRDPLHLHGHVQAAQYWCAKWHGSDEELVAFATAGAERSPGLAVLPLVAALELAEDERSSVWRARFVTGALDTLLTRLSEKDSAGTAHTGDARDREERGWAAMALTNSGRCDEAVEQFRALRGRADGEPWTTYFHDPRRAFLAHRHRACLGASKPGKQ
ncbi:DUF4034 domain-containing protein [Actinokineospora enzanensis]|uniref:DUF4034 domain-containing protein n=1 Tax=Actinokineospora enzanensis TaxID=155975 RepID=UPI0003606819|nr:DUF4034 domain-containing protein [Actinokineospora enzanensis]